MSINHVTAEKFIKAIAELNLHKHPQFEQLHEASPTLK
jgi:hypothetical protein